jgi:hypothetical protein
VRVVPEGKIHKDKEYFVMNEKNYLIILNALAKQIEEMELSIYLKNIRIKELEEKLGGKKNA